MNCIFSNFSRKPIYCLTGCGSLEDMNHKYICEQLSDFNYSQKLPYENIYNGKLINQIGVYSVMEK